jgi:hypothetical protein
MKIKGVVITMLHRPAIDVVVDRQNAAATATLPATPSQSRFVDRSGDVQTSQASPMTLRTSVSEHPRDGFL